MPKPILVLVESPSKCRKIEKYLGPGYKVVATFGHLMKLNSLENIEIFNNFHCNYEIIPDRVKNVELIRQYINDVPEVILACDNDREGEAICATICRLFHLPIETTKRIIFSEITESAIQNAIRNPTTINMNLVNAQHAREVLDILVGFTVSPILWKNITRKHDTSLSAGRCQTPALRLVYDNYLNIKNSASVLKYKVFGIFTNLNLKFELNKEYKESEEVKFFLELSKTYEFTYIGTTDIETRRSPPEPFSTSRMQQISSNIINLSPKDTMKYAQELYEAGYITYMRTDSKKYSSKFIDNVMRYITTTYSQEYLRENLNEYIKPINSNEPHEAIRPVNISITRENLEENNSLNVNKISSKAIKLYELIWENSIQSCMSHSRYNIITCHITAPEDTEFRYKIENNIFLGWEIINNTKNRDVNTSHYIRNLRINSTMPYKKIESEFIMTGKKSHLTEALLVNLLEEKGIGRPSTFASLIDKIQFRKYIEKKDIEGIEIKNYNYKLKQSIIEESEVSIIVGNEKNKLVITPLGIIIIEFLLEKMEELFNYEYTQNMECELDLIASENKIWQTLCQTCYDKLTTIVNESKTFSIKIDDNHSLIMGKYGPVIKVTNKYGKFSNFLKVRNNLDLDELRTKELVRLEDIIENNTITTNTNTNTNDSIGKYKGKDLYVKKGKYGIYAQWGDERKSLKEEFGSPTNLNNIKYLDVLRYLEKDDILDRNKPPGFVKELTENISIRNGKWGDYIYYKKPRVKNPVFIPLKDFNENHRTCDKQILLNWLKINHGVKF